MPMKAKNSSNPDKKKTITIVDIARMAGVSTATVSAAFNKGSIRKATYDRVMSVSNRVGYRPNRIARSMVTKQTHVLGLILYGVITELMDSATTCATRMGYDLMAFFSHDMGEGGERRCVDRLLERMVDGVILMPQQNDSVDYGQLVAEIRSAGSEVVMIDRCFREIKVDSVVTDNQKGAFLAVNHLISQGHRRIALVRGLEKNCSSQIERFDGYIDALSEAGIPFDKDLVYVEPEDRDLNKLFRGMLVNKPDITAIFGAVDYLAYEAITACRQLGIRIPEDVSLVGYDDVLMSGRRIGEMLHPQLTTIRQDFTGMVNKAIELLIERINGKSERCNSNKIYYLEPELIVRESTKKPRV